MYLKSYLRSRRFTYREFAKLVKIDDKPISAAAIGHYIRGSRIPDLRIAKAIEEASFGKVTIEDQIEYWEEKNKERKHG